MSTLDLLQAVLDKCGRYGLCASDIGQLVDRMVAKQRVSVGTVENRAHCSLIGGRHFSFETLAKLPQGFSCWK